jgi:hypothetical protein
MRTSGSQHFVVLLLSHVGALAPETGFVKELTQDCPILKRIGMPIPGGLPESAPPVKADARLEELLDGLANLF